MPIEQANNPYFSIIIATFNAEKSIARCLDSLLTQHFVHKEILIQDGGSFDRTKKIIAPYSDDIAYFESRPDKGIYDAWNRALPHASGEWICFLGADDMFADQDVLVNYSRFLKGIDSKTKVVYGKNHIINSKGEILYTIGKPWQELRSQFNKTMCLPHQGLMHHRTVFDDIGGFDDAFKIAGDYELLLRIFNGTQPAYWPYPVCMTAIGGISTLPKNNLICLMEIRKAQIYNGLKGNSLLWIKQWVGAFIRWLIWQTMGEKLSRFLFDAIRKVRGLDPFWSRAI